MFIRVLHAYKRKKRKIELKLAFIYLGVLLPRGVSGDEIESIGGNHANCTGGDQHVYAFEQTEKKMENCKVDRRSLSK